MIEQIAVSMKGIEKASKKSIVQMEAMIDTLKAENENLRNELSQLREEKNYKNQQLNKAVLKIIDILDLMDNLNKYAKVTNNKQWIEAFDQINSSITKYINEIGLVEVLSQGQMFDGKFHECVGTVKKDGSKKNEIIEVVKKGYIFHGTVIRYAQVKVAE